MRRIDWLSYRETVAIGMRDLERAIRDLRAQHGARWLSDFVGFYRGEKRTCEPGEAAPCRA